MLDIKKIRENPEDFKSSLARKGVDTQAIETLLKSDKQKNALQSQIETMKAEQNAMSKKIPSLSEGEKDKVMAEMKTLSDKRKTLESEFETVEQNFRENLFSLPNPPYPDASDGKSEEDNEVLWHVGEKPVFDFTLRDHADIAEDLDILDTKRSAKVSGARFYYLKNELATLQRALVFWAFMKVQNKGFSPMIPPFMTKADAIRGTGFFDRDENYCVNPGEDDLYLIGTSEVPMTSYFADDILEEKDMPYKFVAYSPCFRREAGSYGRDTRGIFRVHQFEKVEMVIFCLPEKSTEMHELLRETEEEILQDLGIHYQVVNVCCGDLGASAAKKYDLEAWLPGQGAYREMTSTSICTDFQMRRLNTRVRRESGEIVFAHALNGTAVSSRPLVAILENFQQKDGSVIIPEVLRPLCGFDSIQRKK